MPSTSTISAAPMSGGSPALGDLRIFELCWAIGDVHVGINLPASCPKKRGFTTATVRGAPSRGAGISLPYLRGSRAAASISFIRTLQVHDPSRLYCGEAGPFHQNLHVSQGSRRNAQACRYGDVAKRMRLTVPSG